MRFEKNMPGHQSEIVFDPQTSGGLLVAVPAGQSRQAVKALQKADVGHACVIGTVDHYSEGLRLLFK
jgi:selenide,water dikinase